MDKLFFHIWPWTVTLTLDLATQFLVTAHRLMIVNICVKFTAINDKSNGRDMLLLSHLTLNCDLDPSKMVLVHCTAHYDNAYQVSSHSNLRWQSNALDKPATHLPWVITLHPVSHRCIKILTRGLSLVQFCSGPLDNVSY